MGPEGAAAVFGIGLLAGLLSGLVGIGGGVLMVPFLYFFYAHPALAGVRLPPEAATVAAHATSLAVIVPTSLRGAWSFHAARRVEWRAVWPVGLASAAAAALVSRVAASLPPEALRLAFGALLLVSAARLARRPDVDADAAERPLRVSPAVTVPVGLAVGAFSALMGVGGGVVAIPLLIGVVGIPLERVAATSIGVITLTSAAGALSYMAMEPAAPVRPGWSLGYVDGAAALALTAGAVLAVGAGTALNRRMDPRTLALLFAGLFGVMGALLVVENLPF